MALGGAVVAVGRVLSQQRGRERGGGRGRERGSTGGRRGKGRGRGVGGGERRGNRVVGGSRGGRVDRGLHREIPAYRRAGGGDGVGVGGLAASVVGPARRRDRDTGVIEGDSAERPVGSHGDGAAAWWEARRSGERQVRSDEKQCRQASSAGVGAFQTVCTLPSVVDEPRAIESCVAVSWCRRRRRWVSTCRCG